MRKKNLQGLLVGIGVIFSLIASAFQAVANALGQYGWVYIVAGIIIVVFLWVWHDSRSRAIRRQALLEKYGNEEIVDRIIRGDVWMGQTSEQLQEAIGTPVDVDEKVLKTKIKEIWKYHRRGQNRYALRVNLDNGVVVGWSTSY